MRVASSEFFAREETLPDIGPSGLTKLRESSVVVVGVGGVGSAAAICLAKSGVGYLRLIDQDIVEPTNLHRLHSVREDELYKPKAEVIAKVASRSSPWLRVDAVVETLRPSNAYDMLAGVDLVVDCLDNFWTRYVLSEYCVEKHAPFIFTSAVANQAHIACFKPPDTGCLGCFMPNATDRPDESCEALGVTPAVVGLAGTIAASETLKLLLGHGSNLLGHLLTVDITGPDFIITEIPKKPSCTFCGTQAFPRMVEEADLTLLCGGRTASVIPKKPLALDLETVSKSGLGQVLTLSDSVLVYRNGGSIVSLFRNGRLLLDGVDGEEDARKLAEQVWNEASGC